MSMLAWIDSSDISDAITKIQTVKFGSPRNISMMAVDWLVHLYSLWIDSYLSPKDTKKSCKNQLHVTTLTAHFEYNYGPYCSN